MDYAALKDKIPNEFREASVFQTTGTKPFGKVAIGFGFAEKVGEEAARLARGRVLLITDQTILKMGMASVVIESLERADFKVDIFDRVEPEPHIETAWEIQELVRKGQYGVIVGLGGGSSLDVAKVAFTCATNPKDILDYLQGEPITNEGLPSILLPTTSGTGSEVSPFIVMTKEDKKVFTASPFLYASIALVDPLLTVTMPPKVTASTGLDALSHAVEGYIARPSPISDALAGKSVEYVFQYLERACRNGEDLEARFYMSFASVLGMMAYIQGGGLYAHSCSYILTLYNGTPHGMGCGISLPYTLMFNLDLIQDIMAKFARTVDPGARGSRDELAMNMVNRFHQLLGRVGLPSNLKDLGIPAEMVPIFGKELAEKYYRPKNPRPMKADEAARLLELMWEGKLEKI